MRKNSFFYFKHENGRVQGWGTQHRVTKAPYGSKSQTAASVPEGSWVCEAPSKDSPRRKQEVRKKKMPDLHPI